MMKFLPLGSDAALFRRATAIVGDGCDVPDNRNVEPDCLDCTNRRFAPGPGTFDQYFDFLQTMAHRLAASVLRHQLRSIGCTLARPLETNFPSAGPTNQVAGEIGD